MTILDKIAESTRVRVANAKKFVSAEDMKKQALSLSSTVDGAFAFENALAAPGVSFICEVKKASPSKGLISPDFHYLDIAKEYELAGASAISTLTEPEFFMGANKHLRDISNAVTLPVLRKDFIIDDYQIYESKTLGASAILLICALLEPRALRLYVETADHLGLSALVETRDENEVGAALNAGARVIGVNNRDLRTFDVDLSNAHRLRKLIPANVLFVAESGVTAREDVRALVEDGADAILIGEAAMRAPDKTAFLRGLT